MQLVINLTDEQFKTLESKVDSILRNVDTKDMYETTINAIIDRMNTEEFINKIIYRINTYDRADRELSVFSKQILKSAETNEKINNIIDQICLEITNKKRNVVNDILSSILIDGLADQIANSYPIRSALAGLKSGLMNELNSCR